MLPNLHANLLRTPLGRASNTALALLFGTLLFAVPPSALAQGHPPLPDSPAIEQKIDALLPKLTLAEKIQLIGGEGYMTTFPEPTVGLPRLKMTDGPVGVRTWGPSMAYDAGVALAASWDPQLAVAVGRSLGQDARARGVNFLLGPGVNLYRAPMNGRNFEYFGEDPFLASQIVVGYIDGVQSQGVSATVKHYVANNSEYDRHNLDSFVDERTLHELYLPAFEAAVKVAHTGAVMNSYNLLNGTHLSQDHAMLTDVLRTQWGFTGIVMSDWDATYDGVAAANAGLDLEMPTGKFMNAKTLLPAIQDGRVKQATIDEKVRRILRVAMEFGWMDGDQLDLNQSAYNQAGRQVALDGARESLTLLKNAGDLLPLDAAKVKTLAVIGPDAWPAVVSAGGSAVVTTFAAQSYLTGISDAMAGKVNVLYARGIPSPNELFASTRFTHVKREVFEGTEAKGAAVVSTPRAINEFKTEMFSPPAAKPQTLRYSAVYTAEKSGPYLLLAAAASEDAYTVAVDGKMVIEQPKREGQAPHAVTVELKAGVPTAIEVLYHPASDSLRFGLGLRASDEVVSAEAKAIAAKADAVLLCVGFDPSTESEGYDRSFALPWGQVELIRGIAAVNPKTMVTLTAGGAVEAADWLDSVPVLLHNYYPGQEGGTAMAEVLFGQRAPEGRLPFSYDRSWAASPVHDTYYPSGKDAAGNPKVVYSEGLLNGYRYYTTEDKQPLFPFGFGLSYTSFAYSGLQTAVTSSGAATQVEVSLQVTNTGQRAGNDVVELYVGDPSARVKRPERELKGFTRVSLAAGESRTVHLTLDARALAYWDVATHGWLVDPGTFEVFAGGSSADTPAHGSFSVPTGFAVPE